MQLLRMPPLVEIGVSFADFDRPFEFVFSERRGPYDCCKMQSNTVDRER
jgi:hypothetical protein